MRRRDFSRDNQQIVSLPLGQGPAVRNSVSNISHAKHKGLNFRQYIALAGRKGSAAHNTVGTQFETLWESEYRTAEFTLALYNGFLNESCKNVPSPFIVAEQWMLTVAASLWTTITGTRSCRSTTCGRSPSTELPLCKPPFRSWPQRAPSQVLFFLCCTLLNFSQSYFSAQAMPISPR